MGTKCDRGTLGFADSIGPVGNKYAMLRNYWNGLLAPAG